MTTIENNSVYSKCLEQGKSLKTIKSKESDKVNKLNLIEGFDSVIDNLNQDNQDNQDNINNDIEYNNLKKLIDNLKHAEKKVEDIQEKIKSTTHKYSGKVSNLYVDKNISPKDLNIQENNLGIYRLSDNQNIFNQVSVKKGYLSQYAINMSKSFYAISNTENYYTSDLKNIESMLKPAEIRYSYDYKGLMFNTILLGFNGTMYLCNYTGKNIDPNHSIRGPSRKYYNTEEKNIELMRELLVNDTDAVIYEYGYSNNRAAGITCLTTYLGCYKDTADRAIPDYQGESYTVDACHKKAISVKAKLFGLQNGDFQKKDGSSGYGTSQCFTGSDYDQAIKYGNSPYCKQSRVQDDGKFYGGGWTNAVYTSGTSNCANTVIYLDNDGGLKIKNLDNKGDQLNQMVIISPPDNGDDEGIPIKLNDNDKTELYQGEYLVPGDVLYSKNGIFKMQFDHIHKTDHTSYTPSIGLYKRTNNGDFINKYKKEANLLDNDIISITSIPENDYGKNLGKMAFKDEKGNIFPYPESMFKNTSNDKYTSINTNKNWSPIDEKTWAGKYLINRIDNKNETNMLKYCSQLCNNNKNCQGVGIVEDKSNSKYFCDLINDKNFIINQLVTDSLIFYQNLLVRDPTLNTDSTCPNEAMEFISTKEWSLLALGNNMTSNTKCSLGRKLEPMDKLYKDAQEEVDVAANALKNKLNSLTDDQKNEYNKMGDNMKEVNKLINKYENYKKNIEDIGGIGKMGTLGGQIEDTHLDLMSNNYQYMIWTIIAIVIIIAAIKMTR